jgi:hypothetical protein
VRQACEARGVAVEAYSPLGTGRHLADPTVAAVAERLARTPAQVLPRWCVQRGTLVLPKSTHRERIHENAAIFDFSLIPCGGDRASAQCLLSCAVAASARVRMPWRRPDSVEPATASFASGGESVVPRKGPRAVRFACTSEPAITAARRSLNTLSDGMRAVREATAVDVAAGARISVRIAPQSANLQRTPLMRRVRLAWRDLPGDAWFVHERRTNAGVFGPVLPVQSVQRNARTSGHSWRQRPPTGGHGAIAR